MQLVLLRSLGPVLAKTWLANGSIANYDNARQFHLEVRDPADIHELYRLLQELAPDPQACLIRGRPRGEAESTLAGPILRNLDTFEDAPSNLFMLDLDGVPMDGIGTPQAALERFVLDELPPCFHDVSYVWQLSGSMGHPTKAGQLRAHAWFWLADPLTCAEAEAWAKQYVPKADHTVHRTVQINFTADPVTEDGAPVDPYAGHRLGFVQGLLGDALSIANMPVPERAAQQLARSDRATGMKDPRDAPGIVGAFSRAYGPTQLPELWPDVFEAGRLPERITWLLGGGTPEGIRVADNGTHLLNTHATSPMGNGRAHRMWDFVRKHVFGHLDEAFDPEALALDPSAAPSWRAMADWARAQPEVREQLDDSAAVVQVIEQAQANNLEREAQRAEGAGERMSRLKDQVQRMPSLHDLEYRLARPLATANEMTESHREELAIAIQRRTKELAGKAFPIATVRSWLTPCLPDLTAIYPHLDKDGNLLRTIQNLETLCNRLGVVIRYDVIRKRQDILAPGMAYTRDQNDSAAFAWLDSAANEAGMRFTPGQLRGYVCEISARNVHNPVLEWLESCGWDGVSRIDELTATVTLAEGFDRSLARKILRKWMIQAVAAAASPLPLQTRGVLVFAGEQYLGKSRWIKSLLPGHEDLAILGLTVDPHDKDTKKTAISHWIAELGELDGTFKKSDIAALKAFLANDEDAFRLPYAPADSKFQRRTVFAASVNAEEDFLVDSTGNTRFWVCPVTGMDHEHKINMQQLWAEMLHAWRAGEPHWFERGEMELINTSNERFAQEGGLSQRCRTFFPWEEAKRGHPDVLWVWRSVVDIASMLGAPHATTFERKELGATIGKLTKEKSQSRNGARFRRIPMWRSQLDLDATELDMKEAA